MEGLEVWYVTHKDTAYYYGAIVQHAEYGIGHEAALNGDHECAVHLSSTKLCDITDKRVDAVISNYM